MSMALSYAYCYELHLLVTKYFLKTYMAPSEHCRVTTWPSYCMRLAVRYFLISDTFRLFHQSFSPL